MRMVILMTILLAGAAAAQTDAPRPAAAGQSPATQPYPTMAPIEQYLMPDRDAEIALARSAAPASIAKDATVFVLTRTGYETAVEGKNGFVCLVDRGWQASPSDPEFWNPKVRAPTCLSIQAVRSVLPAQMKRTEWALAGLSKDEIKARTKAALEKKEFSPPEVGAMSYMMSKQQYLGDRFTHWQPHLMFYLPNTVKGADWGANLPKSPVLLGPEENPDGTREPINVFLVPVSQWSDDTPAPAHPHPAQ